MRFKGIIFDFNGVLLWDAALHEQAWQQSAMALRGREFNEEEFLEHVHGRTNSHILGYLMQRELHAAELNELTQLKESAYRRLCLEHPEMFMLSPRAVGLLDLLVAEDIPHTIATASERSNLDFFIEHLQLARWFELDRIVYDDGSFPGKPAPDMYARAAANLALPAADCIVVEDAVSGFASAHAAGIGYIVAMGPRERHEKLRAAQGVSCVVTSFKEMDAQQLLGLR